MILTALAGGIFVIAIALLYGATLAPSPRDGFQPVENRDVAFYSILGRDLATTGTETNLSPSGFSDLPGAPAQAWYHWGELWLASAVMAVFGTAPIAARHFIVLPLLLLAAAALTGTLVRRMAGTKSRWAYAFGFVACLFLAPVPLIPGPFFSTWAVGMVFGIGLYGLGAIAVLLALYGAAVLDKRRPTWTLACFVGSAIAFILPAHLALALLAVAGAGGAGAMRLAQSVLVTRRLPIVSPGWGRTFLATGAAVVAMIVWGQVTGHGLASSGSSSSSVSPFNASWRDSIAIVFLGAGAFLAIPVAWFLLRRRSRLHADVLLGTMGLLVAGAIGWGARLGDFTMFYLFFGGIAVFATPVAAVAVWVLVKRLTETRHAPLATGLVIVCLLQLELGAPRVMFQLLGFAPSDHEPISIGLLQEIRRLPADAKLAYSCEPFGEVAFGTPGLLSIDAHTDRRVVPMCFMAEFPSTLLGAERSEQVVSQFFKGAPQLELYPDATAVPSPAAVAAFLKKRGIEYIYVDSRHPNALVNDPVSIAKAADVEVFRFP
ncbi:MAG TPA: hypothetical protein VM427_03185 [Patescibacteria group bacterium]|nr:hypothetical protein [Patescibacteria group bacterium]